MWEKDEDVHLQAQVLSSTFDAFLHFQTCSASVPYPGFSGLRIALHSIIPSIVVHNPSNTQKGISVNFRASFLTPDRRAKELP